MKLWRRLSVQVKLKLKRLALVIIFSIVLLVTNNLDIVSNSHWGLLVESVLTVIILLGILSLLFPPK